MGGISNEVRLEQLQADVDACGKEARALFTRLLAEGKTPEAAAMYACQQAAGTRNSDRAFNQGQRAKMEGMSPMVGKLLHETARKAGIDTRGKYYMSGIGRATDKAAWVTCADDVLAVAKQRNLNVEGVINRRAVRKEEPPRASTPLAPDILRELEGKAIAADPALREKVIKNPSAKRELREALIDKHARKKRPKASRRR